MLFTFLTLFQTIGLQIFRPLVMKSQNIYFRAQMAGSKTDMNNAGAPLNLISIVLTCNYVARYKYHEYLNARLYY